MRVLTASSGSFGTGVSRGEAEVFHERRVEFFVVVR